MVLAFKPRSLRVQRCSPCELNTCSRVVVKSITRVLPCPGRRASEASEITYYYLVLELAVLCALAAELALEVALAVEDLDAVVRKVGNRHLARRGQHCDARWAVRAALSALAARTSPNFGLICGKGGVIS